MVSPRLRLLLRVAGCGGQYAAEGRCFFQPAVCKPPAGGIGFSGEQPFGSGRLACFPSPSCPMRYLLLLPLLFSTWFVCAQALIVRGVVRAGTGRAALPGVSVVEKGTANRTATNAQGRITLRTTRATPRLVVSFIGYVTQEVVVSHLTDSVVVVLQADAARRAHAPANDFATGRPSHGYLFPTLFYGPSLAAGEVSHQPVSSRGGSIRLFSG